MVAGIKIESARDIVREHEGTQDNLVEWPNRCATAQVLLRNDEGRIIETDLYASANIDADGNFDMESTNPLVFHHAPDGVPQHEFMIAQVRERGRAGRVRPWIAKMFSAISVVFMDHRIPAKDQVPEESLGSPSDESVPT